MNDPRVFQRDVTGTRADYLRGMEGAFPGQVDPAAASHRLVGTAATLEVRFETAAARRIAGLTLPALAVTIRYLAGTDADCAALLAHLDRYLHRGGG